MVCKFCGHDAIDKAKFCENCGAALQSEEVAASKVAEPIEQNGYAHYIDTKITHDEIRKNDVKEAEQFFNTPSSDNVQSNNFSQTTHTVYGRDGKVSSTSVVDHSVVDQIIANNAKKNKTKKIIGLVAAIVIVLISVIITITRIVGAGAFFNRDELPTSNLTQSAYSRINVGMTHSEVEAAIGDDCDGETISTENGVEVKLCRWIESGNGISRRIMVTFHDGEVYSKDSYNLA